MPPVPIPQVSEFEDVSAESVSAALPFLLREKLRVDVNGRYPQMTVSGTIYSGLAMRVHWIANVARTGSNEWAGTIWYKDGTVSVMPST